MADMLSRDIVAEFRKAGTIDEKTADECRRKHYEEYSPDAIKDYVAELLGAYQFAAEAIDDEREKYISSGQGREALENAYTEGLVILHHLGGFFHPFSTYGSSMLRRAREMRKDFEKICGPYTVSIDLKSLKYFMPVLSPSTAEDIAVGKLNAIGAMRSGKDGIYGVGALAYSIERDLTGRDTIIRIKWLYVDEDYRERGIADSLLSEVLALAKEQGVAAIGSDIPVTSEWAEVISYWLGKKHFEFTTGIASENVFSIPGNVNSRVIKSMPGTGSYKDMSEKDFISIYTRFLRKNGYEGYLLGKGLPKGYIDRKASCYAGDPVSPDSMLLSHVLPSGMRRVEYIGSLGDDGKISDQKLILAFLQSITADSKKPQEVLMDVNVPDMYPFFDKAMPNAGGSLVLEGLLLPLEEAEDIKDEDVRGFLMAFAE